MVLQNTRGTIQYTQELDFITEITDTVEPQTSNGDRQDFAFEISGNGQEQTAVIP